MGGSVTGFNKGLSSFDVCTCSCHDDRGLGARTTHVMPCCYICEICKLNIARRREETHEKHHQREQEKSTNP
ncbi:MAG: hypothetical protein UV05_C0029G0006 [candidate division CPR1 bacterium GW2011_GWA2_42_17]|uniref:Uncharacterized protein n=1 Tax=candidate division CPR1 bacterium GW2011_GWA2_42_17 TaxID=1618341 RepID=A0A0G0Z4B6_9BACT|nr:MAG: hypothetical protein UV05_C0029G0006 [candidate division CPR1 bacterium GW2011_GWA2_42_17]